jgi:hypothetical protein
MKAKDFFYKIARDLFGVSFAALVFFSLLEWFQPGFVSFYISFNLLLIIPLVSGILTILLLEKNKLP